MKSKIGILIGLFSGVLTLADAFAAQVDVVNDGVHYNNGLLIATEQTDEGDPLIAGNSLDYEDAIIFRSDNDPQDRIPVDLGASDNFVLQGDVVLANPVDVVGNTLQVNGYLVEDSSADTTGSDFSGVTLKIDNYVIPAQGGGEEEVVNGQLVLHNNIKLGDTILNDGVSIHLYKSDGTASDINAAGNLSFEGNNLITGSGGSSLVFTDNGGAINVNGELTIDENVSKTTISVASVNNSDLTVSKELSLGNDLENKGNIYVGGNFSGNQIVNQENSTMTVGGGAVFDDNMENHKATITLNSSSNFSGNVVNDGNTKFIANGYTMFSGSVNNSGNTTMTFNDEVYFLDSLDSQDNTTITTNEAAQFNNLSLDGYAKLAAKQDSEFGSVVTDGHARIVTERGAVFGDVVTTSGNSLVQVKGETSFESAINNKGNAHLQIDGNAEFLNSQTVTNEDNAVIDINGKAIFSGVVNNIDDAQINVNGEAEFDKVVTNSGFARFTNNGEAVFHDNFYNNDESKLVLNGDTTFEKRLYNSGEVVAQGNITADYIVVNRNKMKVDGKIKALYMQNEAGAELELNNEAVFEGSIFNRGMIRSTSDMAFEGGYASSENGKINSSGNVIFAENGSYNQGQINIGGDATFKGDFDNYGEISVTGNTFIERVLTNTQDKTMSLNDVNFVGNTAQLVNEGDLSLSNTILNSSITNNLTGTINFVGNNALGGDWLSDGMISFANAFKLDLNSYRLEMTGSNKTITFNNNGELKFNINSVGDNQDGGKIAGYVVLQGDTQLSPVFAFGLTNGEYTFVEGTVDSSIGAWTGYDNNNLYNVVLGDNADKISFSKKSNDEIADALGTNDAQTNVLDAMLSGVTDNSGFNQLAENVTEMLQSGENGQKEKALKLLDAVSPEEMPIVQQAAVDTSNQVFDVVGARLANRTPVMMKNWRRGMAAGDGALDDGAMWVQGMGNKAELKDNDDHRGFESTTTGVAMGFEKQVTENARAGLGYAYSQTEIDSDLRNIDATTHTAIAYAEYKRNKIFANVIAAYGWSNMEENSIAASAKYVVESMGLQAMAGYYGLTSGALRFIPEAGMRYVHVKQHDYDNSIGVKYDNLNSDLVTGIVGARITAIGGNGHGLKIIPEARLALTYDIENGEDNEAMVTLPNGASYMVKGKALDRFGVEVGLGVTAEINDNLDLSVNYEGKFRKDYSDHTGIIKGKYKF